MSIALIGIPALLAVAFLFSEKRRAISPRIILSAFCLQAMLAVVVLYSPLGKTFLHGLSGGVQNIIDYSNDGIVFLFGEQLGGDLDYLIAAAFMAAPGGSLMRLPRWDLKLCPPVL